MTPYEEFVELAKHNHQVKDFILKYAGGSESKSDVALTFHFDHNGILRKAEAYQTIKHIAVFNVGR
jgi:hypothetical protein